MIKGIRYKYLMPMILCVASGVYAHDTTHIHPLITAEIARLIKNTDTGDFYLEIYKDNPTQDPANAADQLLYWGTDFDPVGLDGETTIEGRIAYLVQNDLSKYRRNNNVIDGVVYEDDFDLLPIPEPKVRHHFYHAKEGIPLTVGGVALGEKSSVRAMTFFNQSINAMSGYSEDSKQTAFFLFGQALHHVEDMSSPAHIHNDVHLSELTAFHEEKDDYEGWWLPQQKRAGTEIDLNAVFNAANDITPMNNPWVKIWGVNTPSSLVRATYSGSTYNATLTYEFSVYEEIANSFEYYTNANLAPLPVGELQEMFPCMNANGDYDTNVEKNCLYWNEDAPDAPAHWVIKGVGDFQHQFNTGAQDSWWPIELETNFSTFGQDPAPFDGNNQQANKKYYIEQLASDNSNLTPIGIPVVPVKVRSDLNADWEGAMITNVSNTSLLEKYASTFLAPAVTYGAGFTQYWYDIANTPPFLKSVNVEQKPVVGTTPVVKYAATWVDQEDADTKMVDSRVFSRTTVQTHIHDEKDLSLTLTFNEPIKQITQLRLGAFNAAGGCALQEQGCVDITEETDVNAVPVSVRLSEQGKVWTITVAQARLAGLNGKLVLTVKAEDRNNHRGGNPLLAGGSLGGDLDATPDTPAKRDLSQVLDVEGKVIAGANVYPWLTNSANAYDYAEGDTNHLLLFDTAAPTATINVDLTL